MRYLLQLIAGILLYISVPAQTLNQPLTTGNTYAIIIGIAQYQDPDIRQLQFANRDAAAFANYLMSASGGSVPKKQIRLLTDTAATIGEVDKALRWVLNNCKENDRVYFYFSGHGEIENYTMSKNGYLICYNTPSVAFVNMGLSIDYLNDVINTLSVRSKAKVILITDACHSGTAAGNRFKGNFFVGEQLMLKKANEIRMASSKPDQLSNERVDWGDGRGVFSYYLLNGLQGGLADSDNDKIVSVGELKNYLENKMANDPVLKNDGDIQTPVINGDAGFKMAKVVEAEAAKVKEQVKSDSVNIMKVISAMSPVNEEENTEPDVYFFNQLKKQELESLTDGLGLNKLTAGEIAFVLINQLKTESLTEMGQSKLAELEAGLRNDKEMLNRFNLDLASLLLDIGQSVIVNYIKGDEAELERRRYYNSKNNNYDVYVRMFEVATHLSITDKYYSTKTTVLFHYFSGLLLRLKIPLTNTPAVLIEQAIAEQKKALELEEYAPYIYNELGVLYDYNNNLTEAEKYYTKAIQLSPAWAIPQSNLSGLFIERKDYSKALIYVNQADSLQKDLQSISINRGFINEKNNNLLFAEEYYYKAIDINSRHFTPFERLAFVNMNTTNYTVADSFFYEADLRKKGYHFIGQGLPLAKDKQDLTKTFRRGCSFTDSLMLKPDDMMALFAWGIAEFYELATEEINADGVAPHVKKNNMGAIKHFKQVIALGKKNPLVYHYLALVYYEQKQWEDAELMFRYAIENYMNRELFEKYVDSVKRSATYPYTHDCYESMFKGYYYNQVEDLYFLASLYEKWGQPVEAENYYKKIIESTPAELGVYMNLWQLLEKQGLYLEAENVLKQSEKYFPDTIYRELNAFYRRTIEKVPDQAIWNYKLGLLLYNHASEAIKWEYTDTIVWFPKINQEVFIPDINQRWNSEDLILDIGPGTSDKYIAELITEENPKHILIPGTGEKKYLAREVSYPRYDGIRYLKQAAALFGEKETLASINYKIAEIFEWAGSKKQAYPYFERSLLLAPENVNTRLKLIDNYKTLFKNSSALTQLNYLYENNLINFDNRLQLARFDMLAGNFTHANELLNKADSIHPYSLPEIDNLYGLLNLLANNPQKAIAAYEKSIVVQQADPWFNNYSIARLYAKSGNSTRAWKYLNRAVDLGFNYSFVLQNDNYMDSLRKTAKWQTMISGMNMKKYK